MESRFFEFPKEKETESFEEIGGKISAFINFGQGNEFGSSYREVRKNEGSRNRDSTVTKLTKT